MRAGSPATNKLNGLIPCQWTTFTLCFVIHKEEVCLNLVCDSETLLDCLYYFASMPLSLGRGPMRGRSDPRINKKAFIRQSYHAKANAKIPAFACRWQLPYYDDNVNLPSGSKFRFSARTLLRVLPRSFSGTLKLASQLRVQLLERSKVFFCIGFSSHPRKEHRAILIGLGHLWFELDRLVVMFECP